MTISSSLYSSRSEEWSTPDAFFAALDEEFRFTLDPCATADNAKCALFFTSREDGLKQDWQNHRVFCNPPYGRTIWQWAQKCCLAARSGALVVLLAHARTDTRWFHDWVYGKADDIRFVRGRLKFGAGLQSAPFPSLVAVYRPGAAKRNRAPLSPDLNRVILAIAGRLFPDGFDVAADAPATWPALKALLDSGKRLVVFGGGADATIYADPAVNHAFRAWHDHTHWQLDCDFSVAGEIAVCAEQCRAVFAHCGDTAATRDMCAILEADIVGQRLFHQRHKRYVDDQRGFVDAYLQDPETALSWSLW